jgi:cell division septation protein DedD
MNAGSNRVWIIATALVAVGVIALGWFLGISPQLARASAADAERASVTTQNQVHEVELQSLKKEFANIDDLRDELDELKLALPETDQMADFISQVSALEAELGVVVTSFSVGEAVHYASVDPVKAPEATPDTSASTAAPADPATPAPADTAAPTTTAPTTATSPNPLVTPENFIAIPVGIKFIANGTVDEFIDGLQHGDRLFLLNHIKISAATATPGVAPGGVAAEVSGYIYVLLNN